MSLNEKITREDKNDFYFFHEHVNSYDYYKKSLCGGAKFLLHANVDDDNQRKHQKRYS